MRAVSSTIIDEEWVKERAQIDHNEPEDNVKSLSLCGGSNPSNTLSSKTKTIVIQQLGCALLRFTRLKILDLSRNHISRLSGLHTLVCLEQLNLYANRIGEVNEVTRLRANQKLHTLDLRLNPIASQHHAQCRLVLVFLLPHLASLDAQPISASDKAAALLYHSHEQILGQSHHEYDHANEPSRQHQEMNRASEESAPSCSSSRRIAMIGRLGQMSLTGSMTNRTAPSPHTNGEERQPIGTQRYSHAERLQLERRLVSAKANHSQEGTTKTEEAKQNNICTSGSSVSFGQSKAKGLNSHSYFTRNPAFSIEKTEHSIKNYNDNDYDYDNNDDNEIHEQYWQQPLKSGCNASTHKDTEPESRQLLQHLCGLVDKYWTGPGSLQTHPAFTAQAGKLVHQSFVKWNKKNQEHQRHQREAREAMLFQ